MRACELKPDCRNPATRRVDVQRPGWRLAERRDACIPCALALEAGEPAVEPPTPPTPPPVEAPRLSPEDLALLRELHNDTSLLFGGVFGIEGVLEVKRKRRKKR